MLCFRIIHVFVFVLQTITVSSQPITVSGYVTERGSREYLSHINVQVVGLNVGTSSNSYGFYSLRIPANEEVYIKFSSVGYKSEETTLLSSSNTRLNVELTPADNQLEEVVIEAAADFAKTSLSLTKLYPADIQQLPSLLGEKDVIKIMQLLPGVQRGTEGTTALYVRGGSADQNLILLDDAPVYNANHLFGFMSVFNNDALRSVEMWKGGFPARYGGRASSVIALQMKEGNKEEVHGEGGIGLISSRLTLEGPLKKQKSSFLVSGRRSYFDLLTRPFQSKESLTAYSLYDLNAKVNFDHDHKNRFFLSGYFGSDLLRTNDKVVRSTSSFVARDRLGWGNATGTFRWNHLFSDKVFSNITLLYSHFDFSLSNLYDRTGTGMVKTYTEYSSKITDYSLKTDLDYYFSNTHHIKTGWILTHHNYIPTAFVSVNSNFDGSDRSAEKYRNLEMGLYLEDEFGIAPTVTANGGIRLSGLFSDEKTWLLPEPRLNISWLIMADVKVNGSYARTNQFVHLLSNTGVGLATDMWVPATTQAPPQQADLWTIGVSKKITEKGFTVSWESYRKYMRNLIAYSEGATFVDVSESPEKISWEDNVTTGKGFSYGTELLVQKTEGRLTGWLGYTLSWVVHEFSDLNYGKRFYPSFDSRHNVSVVGMYQASSRVKLSANWVYGTGNAMTTPRGFYFGNFAVGDESGERNNRIINEVAYFGGINSYRAEAYHRLDIAVQWHKKKKQYERYWEFGLFNAYNRKNPYYYLERKDVNGGQRLVLKKRALFPIIPSFSYNFKF